MNESELRLIEDETRFLSALWRFPDRINEVTVRPDDFYDRHLGRAFHGMLILHNSGGAMEAMEIERIDETINPQTLRIISRADGEYGNIARYEARIKQASERRRLRTAGMMIKERAETGTNISEDIGFSHQALESIQSGESVEDFTAKEMVEAFRLEMLSGGNAKRGIMSHLPSLNSHTHGFQPGEFVVIGAFTNDGKSALKMNFAVQAAKDGHSVGIISLEDSVARYRNRILSNLSGINGRLFRDADKAGLTPKQASELVGAEKRFEEFKLVIAHRAGMTISDIIGKARYWKAKYDINVLFVDYIQIIDNPGFHNYRERMMDTVLKLTAMARNLEIVLVTSSQLNRLGETNPTLSNLAETSKIEHQADYVFLIEAGEDVICGEKTRRPNALVLAKGRDVPKNLRIPITFEPDRMMLRETS